MFSPTSRYFALAALPLAAAAAQSPTAAQSPAAASSIAGVHDSRWTTHHEHVLGTSLEISVRAASAQQAETAEAAVLRSMDADEARLSTWRADSEVSRWAATRFQPVAVSPELFEVLAAFDLWRDRTGGALDASVEAATRLWQTTTAEGRTPTAQEIAVVTEAMAQPHWSLDKAHRTATRLTDIPLALATFTKNYITQRAAEAALKAGASGIMLNVGGDVIVRGNITQLVAVADPQAAAENDRALVHVTVHNAALATSGAYRRGFQLAGGPATLPAFSHTPPAFSHIIDPRTAQPTSHVLSSTVVAQDAMTAGALATAFSILPVAESRTLAAQMHVDYLLVLPGGEQIRSQQFPAPALLQDVAYAVPTLPGLWNPAFELSVNLDLPRIEDARYRRPYVAVWVEDADHFPVRTLALWTQNPRWLPELKQWYRDDQVRRLAETTDISRTLTSATRPPGRYTLKWDGKDNEGKPVKTGKYTVCVEASREHGGYDVQRHELDINGVPQQATLAGSKELGAVALDYRKR